MLTPNHWLTTLATMLVIVTCIIVHYEGLRLLTDRLPTPRRHHRRRIVILMVCLVLLHILEIWIFGVAYYVLLGFDGFGELSDMPASIFDAVYFSATVYTTLGFGDIVPSGPIRFLTGTEALTGLMLITWSASYTFVEMLKTWETRDGHR